ncbi:MAG: hypothetical protein WB630_08205 [Candidatus Acidiferrales bacterium]
MEREYDLFEKLPNSEVMWRGVVRGIENAVARLKELADGSPNEHFALHTPTNAIVARINVPDDSPVS